MTLTEIRPVGPYDTDVDEFMTIEEVQTAVEEIFKALDKQYPERAYEFQVVRDQETERFGLYLYEECDDWLGMRGQIFWFPSSVKNLIERLKEK